MCKFSVGELVRWMPSTKFDGALFYLLWDYLMAQGGKNLTQCLRDHASPGHTLAMQQHDKLGWNNFIEGWICVLYLYIEAAHSLLPSRC